MKKSIISVTFLCVLFQAKTQAQMILDANFADLDFGGPGVSITYQIGDGTSPGDIVLYESVVIISGTALDAIIRTVSLSGGTMTYFDNSSIVGPGMTHNEERFFSPQFIFPSGGGSCEFQIEFIEDGSYDTSTHSGTALILENVPASTYDIDGNGGPGSNQFNEYGGFSSVELGANTNVETTYNSNSGLTKFRSDTFANISNVLADSTRVKVTYDQISIMYFVVGADDTGAAYFFIDFGDGHPWNNTTIYEPPVIDLDTIIAGTHKSDTFCSNAVYFSRGGTNINSNNSNLDELIISITSNEIVDGINEMLLISGAAPGFIPLNFSNGALIPDITLNGTTFRIIATVIGGESLLSFSNALGGSLSLSEIEMLLDSMRYFNTNPTTGLRIFDISVRDDAFVSVIAQFFVTVDCSILPVDLIYFSGKRLSINEVLLEWHTSSEFNNYKFEIMRSTNLNHWVSISEISGSGNSYEIREYRYLDELAYTGRLYYRLKQVDFEGTISYSKSITVDFSPIEEGVIKIFPNPGRGIIQIESSGKMGSLSVYNTIGQDLSSDISFKTLENNKVEADISSLTRGTYFLRSKNTYVSFVKE